MAGKTPLYDPLFKRYKVNSEGDLPDLRQRIDSRQVTLSGLGLISAKIETDGGDIPVLVNIEERVCFPLPKEK
jgi:hypothetical protein